MHYHIVWGAISNNQPSVLNFSNLVEALDKFQEIGQAIEAAENFDNLPGTAVKYTLDDGTLVFRIESNHTRICFMYCNNKCDGKGYAHQIN